MSWFSTGTVGVTNASATLTGVDTSWSSDIISAGDIFLGPDLKLYEIQTADNSTQITLASPYLGSTASAQSYAIIPTRASDRQLNISVQALLEELASLPTTLAAFNTDSAAQLTANQASFVAYFATLQTDGTAQLAATQAFFDGLEDDAGDFLTDAQTFFDGLEASGTAILDGLQVTVDTFLATNQIAINDLSGAIAPINATISTDAENVVIYDTSRDTDGGAWRKRANNTSWAMETLDTVSRGVRADFPAVAIIVAEDHNLTILDGDDPALPMWMVFDCQDVDDAIGDDGTVNGVIRDIKMMQGRLVVGRLGQDAFVLDFIGDRVARITSTDSGTYKGGIAQRNDAMGWGSGDSWLAPTAVLQSPIVWCVTMAVLDNAHVDPVTGIAAPTIAIGCDHDGFSIIDGPAGLGTSIVCLQTSASYEGVSSIVFPGDGMVAYVTGHNSSTNRSASLYVMEIPLADRTMTGSGFHTRGSDPDIEFYDTNWSGNQDDFFLLFSTVSDMIEARPHELAFLDERGGEGNIGGLQLLRRNPSDPPNGLKAIIGLDRSSGWLTGSTLTCLLSDTTASDLTAGANLIPNGDFAVDDLGIFESLSNGVLDASGGNLSIAATTQNWSGTRALIDVTGLEKMLYYSADLLAGSDGSRFTPVGALYGGEAGTETGPFTFNGFMTTYGDFWVYVRVSQTGGAASWDNFLIENAVFDQSGNRLGARITGTITRAAVATGSQLMGFSGWSASNYITCQSAEFTTGSHVMCWVKVGMVWELQTGTLGGLEVDGVTLSGDTVTVQGSYPKALLRISESAPTADQLAFIEADEAAMFRPGAQVTLHGHEDVDTGQYDPDTGLLYVGGISGWSAFDGLVRVRQGDTAMTDYLAVGAGMMVGD